jgi:D-glycero-alpha-D-manno-heptose-7-phosphate kinase
MGHHIEDIVRTHTISASAPCRVDMGGTLDLATFYYPLQAAGPCTFNMALNLRTRVSLQPYRSGWIKVSSRGFESAAFPLGEAPFAHPLGMMFALAVHFDAAGVHIDIDSASPPRSALGGSSVAAVALAGALARCRALAGGPELNRDQIVRRAHQVEETVAGVPCGIQDQLAAAHGGMNTWFWNVDANGPAIRRAPVAPPMAAEDFRRHFLVAYCGLPHTSRDINGTWVRQFLSGAIRQEWVRIADCVRRFSTALDGGQWTAAARAMNEETAIRRTMTPEVLDAVGAELVDAAVAGGCGGRFTGAGGGGCLWAVGAAEAIEKLRGDWRTILARREGAEFLEAALDTEGLIVASDPQRGADD